MMKKFIFTLIVVLLFGSIGPIYTNAITEEILSEEIIIDTTELVKEEIEEEIQSDLKSDFENEESIDVNVSELEEDTIVLETNITQEDLQAQIIVEMDVDTEAIQMTSEVNNDNGEILYQNFDITVHEATEDYLVATFENVETGGIMKMDSRQLQASPIPIAVYIIGAAIIKATIAIVKGAKVLKVGSKSFKQQTASVATNATKNFETVDYKTGSKSFTFSKGNMNHILRGHHPKYWTGEEKSMFDPDLSINDIKKIVDKIVSGKSNTIESGLKSKAKEAVVTYEVDDVKYKLIVKDGYIASLYPVK